MKFFIPGKSPEDAERVYETLRKHYKGPETNARIRSISLWDRQLRKDVRASVGEREPWRGEIVYTQAPLKVF
jgi:hypothetical protein